MHRKSLAVISVLALVLAFCGAAFIEGASTRLRRLECLSNLHAIHLSIAMYAERYNGALPESLQQLIDSGFLTSTRALVCPGAGTSAGPKTNVSEWTDYFYVNWQQYYGTNAVPDSYPLMYDKSLSNHKGQGVNVGLVDGSVRWDPKAVWLNDFARAHKEFNIPLPQ